MNDQNLKRATLRLNLDENTEYSIRTEVNVDDKPTGKVIYPNINIKMPHRDPIQLTGNIAYKYQSSVSFNLKVLELFSSPVKVSGEWHFFEKFHIFHNFHIFSKISNILYQIPNAHRFRQIKLGTRFADVKNLYW